VIRLPLKIEVTSRPAMSGVSSSPDRVGLDPFVTCRYSGRKVTAPKRAKPTMKPTALVAAKVRFRKSVSGRIGSLARRSTRTNAGSRTMLAAMSDKISHESQGHVVPPRLVNRTIDVRAAASSAAPR
jgi:hypothetical protein